MGKRANGEGSVFKRKSDGRWVASLTLGEGPDGKRQTWTTYHKLKREAVDALTTARGERDRGQLTVGAKTTVGEFLTAWLDVMQPTVEPKWFWEVSRYAREHLIPPLADVPLRKLTIAGCQKLVSDFQKEGRGAYWIQKCFGVLRHALNDAVDWQQIQFNPAVRVKLPKVEKRELVLWSPAQVRRFMAALGDDPDEALFVVAILSAARAGELLALPWSAIDWENQTISLQRAVTRVPGVGITLTDMKTRSSRRLVSVPSLGMAALQRQRRRLEAWGLKTEYVFPKRDGSVRTVESARRKLQVMAERLELPVLTFHDLRHLSASLSIAMGASAKALQARMGHSSIEVTMNVYGHLIGGEDRALADRLGEAMGDGS